MSIFADYYIMKISHKIIRAILVVLLVLILATPMALYVTISLPSVQHKLCKIGEEELTKLLGTDVEIESISITPFNQLSINNVSIKDDFKKDALKIETIDAGIDFYEYFKNDKIVITHAALIGLDAKIYRQTPSSPINIQNIITKLQPKDKTKPPTKFDLRINNVVIRESQASWDILSVPIIDDKFDTNHIKISNWNADIHIPQLKNDDFIFNIKRFKVNERSGIVIDNLHGDFHIASTGIKVNDLELKLKNSNIAFSDITLSHNNWEEFNSKIKNIPLDISIKDGSYISLNDLAPFVPKLKNSNDRFNINLSLNGELNYLAINSLNISHNTKPIKLKASGNIENIKTPKSMNIILPDFSLNANANDVCDILNTANIIKPDIASKIAKLGNITINGQFNGQPLDALFSGEVTTSIGDAKINIDYEKPSSNLIALKGDVGTTNLNIGAITANTKLNQISANATFDLSLNGNIRKGVVDGIVDYVDFNNYRYNDINLSATIDNNFIEGNVAVNDPNITLTIEGDANIDKKSPLINVHADIKNINFLNTNLSKKYLTLSTTIDANIDNFNIDEADGYIHINDLTFSDNPQKSLHINNINIETQNSVSPQFLSLESDFVDAKIDGSYSFKTILPTIKDILSHSFPVFFGEGTHANVANATQHNSRQNNFTYHATIKKSPQLFDYFNISYELFSPITISGEINHPLHKMNLVADVPYVAKKNKLIEKTQLEIDIDPSIDKCLLRAFTEYPTKHGKMPLEIVCNGSDNQLDASVNWVVNRKEMFKGDLSLSSSFSKDENNNLTTDLTINPSNLIFNDSVWTIQQAHIHHTKDQIIVDNFDVRHSDQFITIEGKASPSPEDVLCIDLRNVNLDYIFQTLEINNVTIGGDATGTFYASQLFSKTPVAYTNNLNVKGISYNSAVFGDAMLKAHWNNENQAVHIDADIAQANKENSQIYAKIYPIKEALDLKFVANKLNASFMNPFMSAFASDVQGKASGNAHLYGTFKNIDMTGDIFVEDFKFKINYTNVYYTASDSIRIRPGIIELNDIAIRDMNNNTGTLNGWLKHTYFKEAEFNFDITNTKNLLCYDINEHAGDTWYGHINGNGSAHIDGKPGVVNIKVDMTTSPKSNFTFVISDMVSASEYSFLTFRDKEAGTKKQETIVTDEPIEVVQFKEKQKKIEEASSSEFNIQIKVDVTPQALITLVMDPVGGDKIRGTGKGTLRLDYGSREDEVKMYGTYNIDEGSYNFTLQDIIIKDFKIRNNSSVSFNGDPMAAQLDIIAAYPVKANLSDLDESFLQDKDLNRTNVPVNALLYIKDEMTQPNISFGLEFPTLKQDAQSKVMSIISTDEMMKIQILYLLALNRFYTPEYMSTTKGNELFSVASSTLSSQLSSMLGQISDNWTISPYLRSDLGDFSDVEVDVALSSTLLNNRLRLNGNFGYRDKSLNTNQFIGDFDIEYLLNPRGSWRLKAYNRYNDQNYYLKTALTTQGVGIMYRQDFDNMFAFLKKKKRTNTIDTISVDTIKVEPIIVLPADSSTTK